MTITARNIGRINVWPTYDDAREADTPESEFVCQLTVYRTNAEARDNLTSGGGGAPDWVPANALIHIDLVGEQPELDPAPLWIADFASGNYSIAGSPAAYDDIIDTDDPDDWGNGEPFTPGTGVGGSFSVVPALAAPTLADGGSFVAVVNIADTTGAFKLSLYSADYDEFNVRVVETGGGGVLTAKSETQALTAIGDGEHTIRLTITLGNVAVSVDGAAPITLTPSGGSAITFHWFVIEGLSGSILKSLACYAPVPNVDLLTLPTGTEFTPNPRAWVDGVGEVAVDTLLGSDPNTENGWGTTEYNPAHCTADGYIMPGSNATAFIGIARTLLLTTGFTMRVSTKIIDISVNKNSVPIAMMATDGNDGLQVTFSTTLTALRAHSFNGSLDVRCNGALNSSLGSLNVAAFTLVGTRYEQAGNGSAVEVGVLDDTDRPSVNPFTAVLIDADRQAIQSITLYAALPSTDGLSELSEI